MPLVECLRCRAVFEKSPSQIRRSPNHYCSRSCAASVNNRVRPKRQKTNACRVCGTAIASRDTYCTACWSQRLPAEVIAGEKCCSRCRLTKPLDQFYTRSRASRTTYAFCKACANAYAIRRWKIRKLRAVAYLGGRCQDCGNQFHPNVFEFHHLRDKDFAWNKLRMMPWGRVLEELDKCALLCANCHRMRHVED